MTVVCFFMPYLFIDVKMFALLMESGFDQKKKRQTKKKSFGK